ncbi:Glucosamine-6-phosphate deaminase [Planctomycetales bacterium 10988]|nr:Glucosamine-6-phosphate deaminase [Planctomycetales bacterium 10988]
MRVIIEPNLSTLSQFAAEYFSQQIRRKPQSVLGLATGGTPLELYRLLIKKYQDGEVDPSQIQTFNLDEYVGIPSDHEQSYRTFMEVNLFRPLKIREEQIHFLDGMSRNFEQTAQEYELAIQQRGGIDLQLLGIGRDGHIAFNEPGSSLASRTRLKTLTYETRRDNARFFGTIEKVPRLALTMGIGTILDAKECLLIAGGEAKAEAVAAMIEGPVTAQVTASALQMHPRTICLLDEAAASRLKNKAYYLEVEQLQRELKFSS